MEEIYYNSNDKVSRIHACIWKPEGEVKGVVQIIHGMCEYAERYAKFAKYLTAQGFVVCAEDHLGHGKTANTEDDLGYFAKNNSINTVLADVRELEHMMRETYADKPYFIMGHSMGSFICRTFISLYGNDFDGAIIMGTGFKSKFTLSFALFMVRLNALFFGWRHRSKLLKKLAFGSYNKKFKPARTQNDWLSVNCENVDNYEKDRFCNFSFTNNGYKFLFGIIKKACSKKTIKSIPKDLPVYFVAGGDDPVGDYGKGVKKAKTKFVKAGIEDVSITLYERGRHEILNDECSEKVSGDILNFINSHIK